MKHKTLVFFISICLFFSIPLITFIIYTYHVSADENSDVKITNIEKINVKGTAETLNSSFDNDTHSVILNSSLADIGDSIEYKVTIKNSGKTDVYLEDVKKEIKNNTDGAIDITISGYTKGEALTSGNTTEVNIKIECLYSTDNNNISAEITFSFKVDDGKSRTKVSYNCVYDKNLNFEQKDCSQFDEYKTAGSYVFPTEKNSNIEVPNIRGYKFRGWADTSGNILTDENGILLDGKGNITVNDEPINIFGIFEKKESPIINNIGLSATTSSITAAVSAEATNGIAYYEFKIEDGSYINNDNNNAYTFTDLKPNMNYTITVRVCDKEGLCTAKSTSKEIDYNKILNNLGNGLYTDETEENRYIYKGENPDNYVKLGDELYRIIALEEDGTFLLIKNNSLENKEVYDTGYNFTSATSIDDTRYTDVSTGYCYERLDMTYYGCNIFGNNNTIIDFKTNKVKDQINGYTLPEKNASINIKLSTWYNTLSDNVKNLINEHKFNVGYANTKENQSLKNTVISEHKYQWQGYVALATVSDYVKANSNSSCNTIYKASNNSDCSNTNWMPEDLWLITPYLSSKTEVYSAEEGKVQHVNASSENYIYPVFYLNSGISFSGSGTSNDPYILLEKSGESARTSSINKPVFSINESNVTITYEYKEDSTNPKNTYEYKYIVNSDNYYYYDKTLNKFIKYTISKDNGILEKIENEDVSATIENDKLIVSFELSKAGETVVATIQNTSNLYSNEVSNSIVFTPDPTIKPYSENDEFWKSDYIKDIKTVTFDTYVTKDDYDDSAYWDISEKGDNSVIAYVVKRNDGAYDLYIMGYANKVVANKDSSKLFSVMTSLESINFDNNFDTSNVNNMSYMFANLSNLSTIVGLEDFDTSKVTDMSYMFENDTNIYSLNLKPFDTRNVLNYSHMFSKCTNLSYLNICNFNNEIIYDIDDSDAITLMFENVSDPANIIYFGSSFELHNVMFDKGIDINDMKPSDECD